MRTATPPDRREPGAPPPPGALRTGATALRTRLFAPAAQPGVARHRTLAVALLLAAASVPLNLYRQPGSALDNLWAEDGSQFLNAAYAHPLIDSLLTPYAGYASVYPRLVAAVGAHVEVQHAPVVMALGGALACAAAIFMTVVGSEGHLRSLGARAVLGASIGLFPLAGEEVAASTCNAQWYFMAAALWAILWRSRGPVGGLFAGLLLALGASNDPLLGLFLPIAVLRAVALPRWRDNIPGIGLVLGLLAQVPSLVHPTLTRPGIRPTPSTLVDSWLYRGVTDSLLGPQLPVHLGWTGIAIGAGALVLAVVVVAATGGRVLLAVIATVLSAALYLSSVDLRWKTGMTAFRTMEFSPRYNLVPTLLCLTVLLLAVDAVLARSRAAGGTLLVLFAVAALVSCVIALPLAKSRLPLWSAQLPAARSRCIAAGAAAPTLTVPVTGAPSRGWITEVPCGKLLRSAR